MPRNTGVLLSGIAYPASGPGKILAAWRHGSVDVLLSSDILDESRRVLARMAHRHGLASVAINDLVDALAMQVEVIELLPGQEPDLRDFDGQSVLGTLLAAVKKSGANYLITGEKGLLAIWLNASRSSLRRRSGPRVRASIRLTLRATRGANPMAGTRQSRAGRRALPQ